MSRFSTSTPCHKYDDVCWERDGDQIEARRRVDVQTSARRSNKEMGPSRPNPLGGWGLRAISLSFVVDDASASPNDAPASPPPLFATSPRKPHPHTSSYLWQGVLVLKEQRTDYSGDSACYLPPEAALTFYPPCIFQRKGRRRQKEKLVKIRIVWISALPRYAGMLHPAHGSQRTCRDLGEKWRRFCVG